MNSGDKVTRVARFGVFELDLSTGELSKDGRRIPLQEQPARLLTILVEKPDTLVTRDELRAALWPPDTFVDFDHGISKAASKVRDALGDSAGSPRFVETVGRRGYRFIAPVERRNGRHDLSPPSEVPSDLPVTPPRYRRRLRRLAAISTLVGGAAVVWLGTRPDSGAVTPRVAPVTSFAGHKTHAALAPDGNTVAFCWDGATANDLDLYVKHVDPSEPHRLVSSPENEYAPAWSPDARHIAFIRRSIDHAAVYVVPSLGGPEHKIADVYPTRIEDLAVDWSPDRRFLALADKDSDESTLGIVLVSVDSGQKRQLTSPSGRHLEDAMPRFSPDGRSVAFARGSSFLARDIFVIPVDGGEPKRITSDGGMVRGLAWTADGDEIIYSSNRSGLLRLWRIAREGGEPRPVADAGGDAAFPSLSRQGRSLAYVTFRQDGNIWRTVGPLSSVLKRPPERFIASTMSESRPSYSPDGSRIVFSSNRSGTAQLWVADSNGQDAVPLTHTSGASPVWSPDGSRIAYDALTEGQAEIFTISLEGGRPHRVTLDASQDVLPSWSADGRSIYFASNRSGTYEIWNVPADGGIPRRVTQNGGFQAFESADGKFLYYDKGRGPGSIWRMPSSGGNEVRVLDGVDGGYWALMKGGICFLNRNAGSDPAIEFFDFTAGRRTWLTPVSEEELAPGPVGFAVSPDGQWVLYKRLDRVDSDIMLVESFR